MLEAAVHEHWQHDRRKAFTIYRIAAKRSTELIMAVTFVLTLRDVGLG
jgi:hypothetical protein